MPASAPHKPRKEFSPCSQGLIRGVPSEFVLNEEDGMKSRAPYIAKSALCRATGSPSIASVAHP